MPLAISERANRPLAAPQKKVTSWAVKLTLRVLRLLLREPTGVHVVPAPAKEPTTRRAKESKPIPPEKRLSAVRRIAIVNHKGGVGKTCLSIHLGAAFAEMGYRTLLCDCDSQGDLSKVYLPNYK